MPARVWSIPFSAALLGAPVATQHFVWQRHTALPGTHTPAMAWDRQRERTVLVIAEDTWEWVGGRWVHRAHTPGLPTQFGALAYDSWRARLVLFGGRENDFVDDTWEFDGVDWQQLRPAVAPAPRTTSIVFEDARGLTVAFGGQGSPAFLGDTWQWNGQVWVQASTPIRPPARVLHGFAHDVGRQESLLFGGYDGTRLGDTWTWNGTGWTQRNPAASPSPRSSVAMAYDPVRAHVVLFGGRDPLWNVLDDTWTWDGTTWQSITVTARPGARDGAAMAFEPNSGRLLLMGGSAARGVHGDTWTWDGAIWRLEREAGPEPTGAVAEDPAASRLVMFGGQERFGSRYSNATRVGDGLRWTERLPATSPSPRVAPIAADRARGEIVLFGGYDGTRLTDTWTWNGVTWTQRAPQASPPSWQATLLYDPSAQRVLWCGVDPWSGVIQLWQWNGVDWSQQPSQSAPSPRYAPTFVFDEARARLVLFGGFHTVCTGLCSPAITYDETWSWDGATWTQALPARRPSARARAQAVYDPLRQRVVLSGGGLAIVYGNSVNLLPTPDVWEWDGVDWQPLGAAAGTWGTLAYEPGRQRVALLQDRVIHVLTATPHAALATGTGCAGSRGVPWLTCGQAALGNDRFAFELGGALPFAPGFTGLAFASGAHALAPGCTLHTAMPALLFAATANVAGFLAMPIAIPADPILRGLVVHAQALTLDPGTPAGFALSNALRVTVGD